MTATRIGTVTVPLAELCLTLMAVALAVAAGALLSRALAQRGTRNAA